MIEKRVEKAQYEMSFAPQFDMIIVNDKLDKAVEQAADAISTFISE
jgi:guanylate kinase